MSCITPSESSMPTLGMPAASPMLTAGRPLSPSHAPMTFAPTYCPTTVEIDTTASTFEASTRSRRNARPRFSA
jgi:hypothetical protein